MTDTRVRRVVTLTVPVWAPKEVFEDDTRDWVYGAFDFLIRDNDLDWGREIAYAHITACAGDAVARMSRLEAAARGAINELDMNEPRQAIALLIDALADEPEEETT